MTQEDLTHIVRTSEQWSRSSFQYQIIPTGVLCVELTPTGKTNIKIGEGNKNFIELPYVTDQIDLTNYLTKDETKSLITAAINNIGNIMRICGKKQTKYELPQEGNLIGDVWFVVDSPEVVNKETILGEYIWSVDLKWELLGTTNTHIDLSEYAKIKYVDEQIGKIDVRLNDFINSGQIHKHINKDILDKTTASYSVEDKSTLDLINSDYITSTDDLTLKCR